VNHLHSTLQPAEAYSPYIVDTSADVLVLLFDEPQRGHQDFPKDNGAENCV
jgi:hypothetical protein